jgi:hypothetical protein
MPLSQANRAACLARRAAGPSPDHATLLHPKKESGVRQDAFPPLLSRRIMERQRD